MHDREFLAIKDKIQARINTTFEMVVAKIFDLGIPNPSVGSVNARCYGTITFPKLLIGDTECNISVSIDRGSTPWYNPKDAFTVYVSYPYSSKKRTRFFKQNKDGGFNIEAIASAVIDSWSITKKEKEHEELVRERVEKVEAEGLKMGRWDATSEVGRVSISLYGNFTDMMFNVKFEHLTEVQIKRMLEVLRVVPIEGSDSIL